jgi:hypothetical protein
MSIPHVHQADGPRRPAAPEVLVVAQISRRRLAGDALVDCSRGHREHSFFSSGKSGWPAGPPTSVWSLAGHVVAVTDVDIDSSGVDLAQIDIDMITEALGGMSLGDGEGLFKDLIIVIARSMAARSVGRFDAHMSLQAMLVKGLRSSSYERLS